MKKWLAIGVVLFFSTSAYAQNNIQSDIFKLWEINVSTIFPKNVINSNYAPFIMDSELIFAARNGDIKTLDIESKTIRSVLNIPIKVETAQKFDIGKNKNFAVFFGEHKKNNKTYYCSVDLEKASMKGVVAHNKEFIYLGEFAIFERKNNFVIFNPSKGKSVYSQKEKKYDIRKKIYTQDKKRYIFQTSTNSLVEIKLPKFGASLIMSPRSTRKDILEFNKITTLPTGKIADNLTGNTLYYHSLQGEIGLMDVKTNEIIWERNYFKFGMSIQGPYRVKDKLFYLVSHSANKNEIKKGKIICINKNTGQSIWISKDLPFNNFGIVHFDKYILSANSKGDLLFLNINDGNEDYSTFVGEGITTPIVNQEDLYVMTNNKIYRFFSNRIGFKIKLFWERFLESIT